MELNDYVNHFVKSKDEFYSVDYNITDFHKRKEISHAAGTIFYVKSISVEYKIVSLEVITSDCKIVLMPNFFESDFKDDSMFEIID